MMALKSHKRLSFYVFSLLEMRNYINSLIQCIVFDFIWVSLRFTHRTRYLIVDYEKLLISNLFLPSVFYTVSAISDHARF